MYIYIYMIEKRQYELYMQSASNLYEPKRMLQKASTLLDPTNKS